MSGSICGWSSAIIIWGKYDIRHQLSTLHDPKSRSELADDDEPEVDLKKKKNFICDVNTTLEQDSVVSSY